MMSNLELQRVNEQLLLAAIREQESADRARQQTAEMDALLGALQDGVVTIDPHGTITLMNPVARSIFRIPGPGPHRTVPAGLALPLRSPGGEAVSREDSPLERARRGERFGEAQFELVRSDERPRWLSFTANPIHGRDDTLILNVVAIHDVTELHELERMKEEYVALISHDLRNPLFATLIHVEGAQAALLARGLVEESEALDDAIAEVAKMDSMIQDLLDSARMESATLTLNRRTTDLHELVRDVTESMAPENARVRVEVPANDPLPTAEVDAARLGRAVANVIGNALKYSPRDAPVEVRLSASTEHATIEVADQGSGIPQEDLPRLFDRYYRASTRREERGHGLGLYIARQVLEAHGGSIGVQSHPGAGSVFRITVPLTHTA
jgi:two-component system, NtrC family, sensor histidine kinase KinB